VGRGGREEERRKGRLTSEHGAHCVIAQEDPVRVIRAVAPFTGSVNLRPGWDCMGNVRSAEHACAKDEVGNGHSVARFSLSRARPAPASAHGVR